MLRPSWLGLLTFSCLVLYVSADDDNDGDFAHCNCHDDGFLSLQTILDCQKVSDFLIAIAYFSIPIEILYFVSFSNLPFKWVFFQFIAFIVLCGLTHLINAWTYYGPHSFRLMLSLTVAKFLTALVSCATAITLFTLFPLLLKVKVRELFLRQNVLELGQEVGMMKRQKEASWHVRMLTREIRKSLDKHTILYTTLVELSKTLDLRNCAVWLPDEQRTRMSLFHELNPRPAKPGPIPIENDPDIAEIIAHERVRVVRPGSALAEATRRGDPGSVAAIRMPMLRVSNFKGGTPEMVDTWYAVLVLVHSREWSRHEMEIVEVVADQVAVALSHADVLEESQIMREKLAEQNRALQRAKKSAVMASRARVTFQKVMSHGMRRPMHSILGLLSMLKEESIEKLVIVDTMIKTGDVLSALIDDSMEVSDREPLRSRPFELHPLIREAVCLVKCLCMTRGFDFAAEARGSVPNRVVGDETRAFQVILHMVGYLLSLHSGGDGGTAAAVFRVSSESTVDDRFKVLWRSNAVLDEFVSVKFEFEIGRRGDSRSDTDCVGRKRNGSDDTKEGLSFNICKRLVQMMQGDIWISPSSEGCPQSMTLVLRFQTRPSFRQPSLASGISPDHHLHHRHHQAQSNPSLRGLRVILADDDDVNRTVTKKLLEKLGCQVTAVSSGFECLGAVTAATAESPCRVVLLDIHMPEMDGFEVAGRIRKFRSRSWPLIVAVTASAEDDVLERCLQMGMNGLIRKPVVLQVLADELRRVLIYAGEGL